MITNPINPFTAYIGGIKLYKIGNENICEQAPAAFKDVMKVVDVLKSSHLTKPIALVKPLAIIKG